MIAGVLSGLVNGTEQVIFDTEVSGSAVSSISTGNILNGNEDGWYTFILRIIGSGTAGYPIVRFNGDSGTNYGQRGIYANSTAVGNISNSAVAQQYLGYGVIAAGYTNFTVGRIYAKSGSVRLMNYVNVHDINGTTVNELETIGAVWNNTADNLVSAVFSKTAGDLGIGTRIIILKSNNFTNGTPCGTITTPKIAGAWVRVGSQVLSSPASSVTFSGLDGDTAVCYYLSIAMKTAAGAPTGEAAYLQFNSDTSNNYGQQRVTAESTTIAAARATGSTSIPLGYFAAGNYVQMNALWFSKSGFLRPIIAQSVDRISGTTVNNIRISGQSWSNTASNLTSAVVTSTGGSYFDTGSQFDLYALYK